MLRRILISTVLVLPAISYGETCDTPSLKKKIKESDYVFSGRVIERKKDHSNERYAQDHESCGPKFAKFEVFTSWKGGGENGLEVYSWDACDSLGTYFDLGEDYLVFAKMDSEDNRITDLYGCYTETLIEAINNKSIGKLDRKFKKTSIFENSKVLGVWNSYGNESDKGFPGVDTVSFEFMKRHKFQATTKKGQKAKKYKGVFYVKGGGISLYDEDGPQQFKYRIIEGILVFESSDGRVLYHLKKT